MAEKECVKLPAAWIAKWITPEEITEPDTRKPAGYLRKRFCMPAFRSAHVYVTAHGLYTLYLNGQRVGQDVLTPGCDEYTARLQVQQYDVTPLLREGENEALAVLGDGWYRGCSGIDSVRNLFGGDLSFLCQLETEAGAMLVTDASWEASQSGPIRMTDLQQGEVYDARMEEITDWHPAREMAFGYDNLVVQECVFMREKEQFTGKLMKTPGGEFVFDFGQNLAGYTELNVRARGGETIRLIHGETLDENGNFTVANFQPGERNKMGGIRQEIIYTCKPGLNHYRPSFSLFGFRYAKAESDLPAESVRLTAQAVYSDMRETASFTCGNDQINQLFRNSLWSMKSNFCDVPTDCPTRERAGWTGDAGVFAPTGLMLMDCASVLRKWLANARVCQHEDGKMAYIIPHNGPGGQISEMFSASVGWGDAAVLVPWAIYEATEDVSVLQENYGMMTKWVDFLRRRAQERRPGSADTPFADWIIDTGMDYGEWCEPGANVMLTMQRAFQFGQPEVATAYFAHSAELLSRIAGLLGKTEDQKKYTEYSQNAKEAYRYLWNKDIYGKSTRQCEYVRPLAFGLLEEADQKKAAKELNRLVSENGYHLNTGFLSTPFLCQALAENGYVETAYRLLLQEDCPSWLYAVKRGATTIWETWNGVDENSKPHESLNHYAYGAISGWLLKGVCGIQWTAGDLTIAPMPHPLLKHAEAVWQSPQGEIRSAWRYEGNKLIVDFAVPVPAKVLLPGKEYTVEAGEYHDEIHL